MSRIKFPPRDGDLRADFRGLHRRHPCTPYFARLEREVVRQEGMTPAEYFAWRRSISIRPGEMEAGLGDGEGLDDLRDYLRDRDTQWWADRQRRLGGEEG